MSSGPLVPYRGSSTPSSTALVTTTTAPSSLIPARLFTAQTGHALATELLYRLLFDLLNRLLASLHRFAARQLDSFSSFLERRWQERAKAMEEARLARIRGKEEEGRKEGLGIVDEVGRVARGRGFLTHDGRGIGEDGGIVCPLTGKDGPGEGARRRPPGWVGLVLEGIEDGRIVEKDFWGGNTFQI